MPKLMLGTEAQEKNTRYYTEHREIHHPSNKGVWKWVTLCARDLAVKSWVTSELNILALYVM